MKRALIVLLLLASSMLHAKELDDMQVALIYSLVYGVTHLPLPEHPPVIHTTTHEALVVIAKDKLGIRCPTGCPTLKALQVEGNVYLDQELDMQEVQNAAVLFHEFVHYYQWDKKLQMRKAMSQAERTKLGVEITGQAESCAEWKDREIAAYHWQNEVLFKAGKQLVQPPHMVCNE